MRHLVSIVRLGPFLQPVIRAANGHFQTHLAEPGGLVRDPPILILDDAVSSVDTPTEDRILTHLAGAMHNRTLILISHRVSTVRQADAIVVLERGRIVEQGAHDKWWKPGCIARHSAGSRC